MLFHGQREALLNLRGQDSGVRDVLQGEGKTYYSLGEAIIHFPAPSGHGSEEQLAMSHICAAPALSRALGTHCWG